MSAPEQPAGDADAPAAATPPETPETPSEPSAPESLQASNAAGVDIDRERAFPDVEAPTSFWMVATQFVIAPMLIAVAAVGVYFLARTLTAQEARTLEAVLDKIEHGGRNVRKQAAFDLSTLVRKDGETMSEKERGAIVSLFARRLAASREEKLNEEELNVVRLLALCLFKLAEPSGEPVLKDALTSEDEVLRIYAIYALGNLQRPSVVEPLVGRLVGRDDDPTVREVAAYALGSVMRADVEKTRKQVEGYAEALKRTRDALNLAMTSDSDRLVRFNAAVALARTGDGRAVAGLKELLDLEQIRTLPFGRSAQAQQVSGKMTRDRESAVLQAIEAAAKLGDARLRPVLEKIAEANPSRAIGLKAREALTRIEGE